jgi:hypothetical protein
LRPHVRDAALQAVCRFHGYLGNRRTVSFGWKYDYAGRVLRVSDDLPAFSLPLRDKAADLAGLVPPLSNKRWSRNTRWHRLAPRQADVCGCHGVFIPFVVQSAVSPQTGGQMGATVANDPAALALSLARPGALGLISKHPSASGAALFGDVSQLRKRAGRGRDGVKPPPVRGWIRISSFCGAHRHASARRMSSEGRASRTS